MDYCSSYQIHLSSSSQDNNFHNQASVVWPVLNKANTGEQCEHAGILMALARLIRSPQLSRIVPHIRSPVALVAVITYGKTAL